MVFRFGITKSPRFEGKEYEEGNRKEIYSRSYNRNYTINKRTFINPQREEGVERLNAFEDREQRNYGRSASHGFERNFKSYGSLVKNHQYGVEIQENKCDLKFNEKSVNYDMSEIELPAYCKTHPDGKLLYIITPEGKESELGCVYCVIEINQKKLRHRVVEVKQKLSEYIEHTSKLIGVGSKESMRIDEQIVEKINNCKESEINKIREHYDKIIEALVMERDKCISQIDSIAEENISLISNSLSTSKQSKPSKYDTKLKNFGIELGKVLEGVDETGIHIKELWKINQDYNDVVYRKSNEIKNSRMNNGISTLKGIDLFIPSDAELNSLTSKICQMQAVEIPFSHVNPDEIFKIKSSYEYSRRSNGYLDYSSKYENREDYVPTFGSGNNENYSKDYYYYYQKYYQNDFHGKYPYKNSNSFSPARDSKYSYEPSDIKRYQHEEEKLKSFGAEDNEDGKYSHYNRNLNARNSYENLADLKDNRAQGNVRSIQYSENPRYSFPSYLGNKNNDNMNTNDIDSKNIEEIKKKYSKDKQKPEERKMTEIYNDYKKEVDLPKQDKQDDYDNSNEEPFSPNDEPNRMNENGEGIDIKEAIVKKNIKKLKTKTKGEKENVLKAIKLKIK